MPPPKPCHLRFLSWPPQSNLYSSTKPSRPPLDRTHTTDTFRQTSMPLSSSPLLQASRQHRKPTNRTPPSLPPAWLPNPTSAANKQPHDRWQYVNLIPTPTVTLPEQPHTPPQFPSPIGGTPRNRRSKTPPRTTTPTRTRQQDPRTGSPTPHRTAPTTNTQQRHATVRPLPKRPPPSLYQAQQPTATTEPLQPVPPATGWPCFQGGPFTPTLIEAPPQTPAPPAHPWPAHYQVPTQQQPPLVPIQVASSTLAPTSPVVMMHPPNAGVDQQGRPLPQSHSLLRQPRGLRSTTILTRIRGTRTTTEHAAAAFALPTVFSVDDSHANNFLTLSFSWFRFQPDDPCPLSSSEARFSRTSANHNLFHPAQRKNQLRSRLFF